MKFVIDPIVSAILYMAIALFPLIQNGIYCDMRTVAP